MVDVKKVTATVSKYYLYTNVTSSQATYIKFNPANNPPNPPGSSGNDSTVYSVDPFSMFTEGPTALIVKIPYSRFYKIKCVISPLDGSVGGFSSNSWNLIKASIISTESLQVNIFRDGVYFQTLTQGVYSCDGSLIQSSEWTSGDSYSSLVTKTPAIVEGIAELYAGDELRFYRTLTVNQKSFPKEVVYSVDTGYLKLDNTSSQMIKYENTVSASFFFEISEITDL